MNGITKRENIELRKAIIHAGQYLVVNTVKGKVITFNNILKKNSAKLKISLFPKQLRFDDYHAQPNEVRLPILYSQRGTYTDHNRETGFPSGFLSGVMPAGVLGRRKRCKF